jgi:hypothetical protein
MMSLKVRYIRNGRREERAYIVHVHVDTSIVAYQKVS